MGSKPQMALLFQWMPLRKMKETVDQIDAIAIQRRHLGNSSLLITRIAGHYSLLKTTPPTTNALTFSTITTIKNQISIKQTNKRYSTKLNKGRISSRTFRPHHSKARATIQNSKNSEPITRTKITNQRIVHSPIMR